MSEKDVVITYETLFELLRIEKNREDLQKLSPTFFDDVLVYLNDKRRAFESKQSQDLLFMSDEKEKTRLEIENIKKILKDLYDRREKKIVMTAINKARTGVALVNTSSMLQSEKMLFDSLNTTLFEFRKNVLFKVACGDMPSMNEIMTRLNITATTTEEPAPQQAEIEDDNNGTGGLSFRRTEEPKELKTSLNLSDSSAATKKVRFLAPIEEIVGPDLQIYGPYEQGTVILLPNELARVLVEKRQAEELLN